MKSKQWREYYGLAMLGIIIQDATSAKDGSATPKSVAKGAAAFADAMVEQEEALIQKQESGRGFVCTTLGGCKRFK